MRHNKLGDNPASSIDCYFWSGRTFVAISSRMSIANILVILLHFRNGAFVAFIPRRAAASAAGAAVMVAGVTRGRFFGGGGIRNKIDLRLGRRKSHLSLLIHSIAVGVGPKFISRSSFRFDGQSARDKPRFRADRIV